MWAFATVGYCAIVSSRLDCVDSGQYISMLCEGTLGFWGGFMINEPPTLQTLAFFFYLHYYFILQVVLCGALGHYLWEHGSKAHTKAKH